MPGSLLHRWQTSSMNFWHAIASKIWLAEMQNIKFRTPPGRQWTKILQFKAKRKTLEPLKFQGFSCLRTSIWIFTTREIWPSGRRHFCAIQAFCRRQNLSAGGIHSRRACKIHCGIHKKDAGAKLYFTAVSEFQDITRNWVLD